MISNGWICDFQLAAIGGRLDLQVTTLATPAVVLRLICAKFDDANQDLLFPNIPSERSWRLQHAGDVSAMSCRLTE